MKVRNLLLAFLALLLILPAVHAADLAANGNGNAGAADDAAGKNPHFAEQTQAINDVVVRPQVKVFGTEYLQGQTARAWVQFLDALSAPIQNATCWLDVYSPNTTAPFEIRAGLMNNVGSNGVYYYDFAPVDVGVHMMVATCNVGTWNTTSAAVTLPFGTLVNGTLANIGVNDGSYTGISAISTSSSSSSSYLLLTGGKACSSTVNYSSTCANAVDGNNATDWISNNGAAGANLTVDLNATYSYNVTAMDWRSFDTTGANGYAGINTSTSTDGVTWQVCQTVTGNTAGYRQFNCTGRIARYVRWDLTSPFGDGIYGYTSEATGSGYIVTPRNATTEFQLKANRTLGSSTNSISKVQVAFQGYANTSATAGVFLFNYTSKKYEWLGNLTLNSSPQSYAFNLTVNSTGGDYLNSTSNGSGTLAVRMNATESKDVLYLLDFIGAYPTSDTNQSLEVKGAGEAHVSINSAGQVLANLTNLNARIDNVNATLHQAINASMLAILGNQSANFTLINSSFTALNSSLYAEILNINLTGNLSVSVNLAPAIDAVQAANQSLHAALSNNYTALSSQISAINVSIILFVNDTNSSLTSYLSTISQNVLGLNSSLVTISDVANATRVDVLLTKQNLGDVWALMLDLTERFDSLVQGLKNSPLGFLVKSDA